MKPGTVVTSLLGLLAVFGAGYAVVRPTNFSGWDEWLVVDLTSRGIVGLPYENRPFSLLFNLPGSLLSPHGLGGFWLVHGLYLWVASACVLLVVRRLAPGQHRLAFLAAALAATWASLDDMRLDPVLLANYSGAAAATLVGTVLLVESFLSRRPLLLVAGGLLGLVAVRALESTAALVVAAPALLWLLPPERAEKRPRARWSLAWLAFVLPALVLAARPLLPGQPASYQVSGLGIDPHPGRFALRLGHQLGLQLAPLVSTSPRELLAPSAALAALLFVATWVLLARASARDEVDDPAGRARILTAGLAGAVLGHVVLVLSPAMRSPSRMQILSAPGMGLLLAGLAATLVAGVRPRARGSALALLGCGVVALGTGRTVAMQREWDSRSLWPAQNADLVGMTRAAPGLAPGTLVLLLDGGRAWPASFTFRHAVATSMGRRSWARSGARSLSCIPSTSCPRVSSARLTSRSASRGARR